MNPRYILPPRQWAFMAFAAVAMLIGVITAQPQAIRIVSTLDVLLRTDPRAYSSGGQGLVYVEGRNTKADWGPPRAAGYSSVSALATNEYAIFAPTNGVGRWDFPDRNDPVQDARHWPIDWTGGSDVTAQFASAIRASADKVLKIPSGTNLVTGLIISNAVALEFNGTLWRHPSATTNIMLAIATNYVSVRGLKIDGQGINPSAIRIQSEGERVFIDQVEIYGLANGANDIATYGIWIGGNGDWEVTRCYLHDFTGTPNEVGGDQYGTVAGIAVLAPHVSLSGPPKRALIAKCRFENFLPGEDSDGIKISGAPYLWQQGFCPGIIEDCVFLNMGSRAIKPAARGWKIRGIFNRNRFDGSTQASGWARTGGKKMQDEVVAAYGPDLTIEDVTSFGGPVRYFSVISSNEYTAPNITYSNVRLLEDSTVPFTNTTSYGIYSLQGAAQHIRVVGANFETRSGAIYSFAPDGDWDISSSSFRNVSGVTNGSAIVIGRSITNYLQGTQAQYRIQNNLFARWGLAGLFYDATNIWPQGNLLVEGTGKFSAVNWVVDNTGTNRWVTNHFSGGFDPAANAGAAVFGEFQTPTWLYSAEFKTRPLWLAVVADEAAFGLSTNKGSFAYTTSASSPGWYDGYRVNFPQRYTMAVASGYTSNNWYRVARNVTAGLGNRFGARIRVGAAGGWAGTFETEIRVVMNFGTGSLQIENTPVDGTVSLALPKAVRLVKDGTNEVTAVDIQASGTSAAQWAVQVLPDVAGPALSPERIWRVGALTNVASLAPSEVAIVTATSISNRIWSITEAAREASMSLEGSTLAITASTIDLRGTLLNNGGAISGGGGGGGSSVLINGVTKSTAAFTNNPVVGGMILQTNAAGDVIGVVTNPPTLTTTQGDITVRGPSGDQRVGPQFTGEIVLHDGTDTKFYSIPKFTQSFDDFVYQAAPITAGYVSMLVVSTGTGAGATILTSEMDAIGIMRLATGTTASGNNCRFQWGGNYPLGGASVYVEWRVRLPVLSNGTDTYAAHSGFTDTTTGAPVDGAEFVYTHGVNSGNWVYRVRNNSSTVGSDVNGTLGPSANTWATLGVAVNAAANSFKFYVNRVLDGQITGTGPTGAGRETVVRSYIESTGGTPGTTSDLMDLDYVLIAYQINR